MDFRKIRNPKLINNSVNQSINQSIDHLLTQSIESFTYEFNKKNVTNHTSVYWSVEV